MQIVSQLAHSGKTLFELFCDPQPGLSNVDDDLLICWHQARSRTTSDRQLFLKRRFVWRDIAAVNLHTFNHLERLAPWQWQIDTANDGTDMKGWWTGGRARTREEAMDAFRNAWDSYQPKPR